MHRAAAGELTPDPPKYKAVAKSRGKHVVKRPLKEGDLDDEPTEEELYEAAIAAELEEGSDDEDAALQRRRRKRPLPLSQSASALAVRSSG